MASRWFPTRDPSNPCENYISPEIPTLESRVLDVQPLYATRNLRKCNLREHNNTKPLFDSLTLR